MCVCRQEPLSPAVSFQYSLLRKLNVIVTLEMLKEIVSVMPVYILKGEFGVECQQIDNVHSNVSFSSLLFCSIGT